MTKPDKLLEGFEFELLRVSGSHHIFALLLDSEDITLVIPFKKGHLNSHYVREALKEIEKIERGGSQ